MMRSTSRQRHTLETFFLALVGIGMIYVSLNGLNVSVINETIILVIFLGGLMGITRIPFPQKLFGRRIAIGLYPVISGLISGVMDSFLVLLLLKGAKLRGENKEQTLFLTLNMVAALIGGLTLYFGEVYWLPQALRYDMRYWHSMIPVWPPIFVFLGFLGYLAGKLKIEVSGLGALDGELSHRKTVADRWDYIEFFTGLGLLLVFHNTLLCLGVLLLYASLTGQGEDLIEVMKIETEVAVMLLLVLAALVAAPVAPLMQHFTGWMAFIPSVINGVLTGALYPATGQVWQEMLVLSTGVLITPVSSLVGVMLFKNWAEWGLYIKHSLLLAAVWFLLCAGWLGIIWPTIENDFYQMFPRPQLQQLP